MPLFPGDALTVTRLKRKKFFSSPRLFLLIIAILTVTWVALASARSYRVEQYINTVSPSPEHPKLSFFIAKTLQYQHYRQLYLDDTLSSLVFDTYLKALDPNRSYFTQEDINQFEKHRSMFDDYFRRGKLDAAFDMFNLYQKRHASRLVYSLNLLENNYDSLDFNGSGTLLIEREEASWAKNDKALDDLTRDLLINTIISIKLTGKADDEIRDLLIKRYNNQLNRLKQTNSEDAFRIYMNALTESYDPHTQYFSPRVSENFDIQMSLSLEGIGAMLQNEDGYTKVKRLVPAGPAEKQGQLKAGDRIVGVGQGKSGEIIDVVGWRLDDVVQLIRGKKGTTVRLQVIPASSGDDHTTRLISIIRNTVKLEEQSARKEILHLEKDGKKFKVGVIEIPTFYIDFKGAQSGESDYKSTTRDVQKLLLELQKENIDALVVDLRDNGGGSLQEVSSLVGLFIKTGPTVQIKYSDKHVLQLNDEDEELVYSGPLAVLVNRLSASASEIFAGAIQDYNRGVVIGDQTFGKGTVQALTQLEQGQLKLTNAKFYRVSGDSTQNLGVLPDITFPSLYDKDEIGESALPQALPWDQTDQAEYRAYPPIRNFLPELFKLHKERASMDPDFHYVEKTIARIDRKKKQKTVSLNFNKRKAEYQASREEQLEIENERRKGKGEKLLKNIQELDDEADLLGLNEDEEDDDDEKANQDKRAYLREAAYIILDFMDLNKTSLVYN